MEWYEALSQLLGLLLATLVIVGVTEGILWWHLKKFESPHFWWGHILFNGLFCYFFFSVMELHPLNVLFFIFLPGVIAGYLFQSKVRGAHSTALMMLAPAIVIMSLLIVFPFFFQLRLAFGTLNLFTVGEWLENGTLGWAGFKNFARVLMNPTADSVWEALVTAKFWLLLLRTLIWTGINIFFHVAVGLGLAMLLNLEIKGKWLYRTLLILPWAMPQVVAVLAWRGEFHPQFGMVNQILATFGITAVNWWSDPMAVFVSCCLVNIWLGIPFMMIVFLGGLSSIPKSYYEASSIDGASKWQQFNNITLPLLKPVVVPSVTLGTIWTFNNINVIYLMTGQDGGNEHADILVSALYKSAFTYSRFSYSAAFAVVVFLILLFITNLWIKVSKGTAEV